MIRRPKGTRDLSVEEMDRRNYVERLLREVCRRYGFREICTPTFEHTELFTARSGPQVVEDMYSFEDKAGRKIALRPEVTASVFRYFVNEMRNAPKPLKWFYMANCFRYEEPQMGRYREFYHFGAELIGSKPLYGDAEIVSLAVECLSSTGLKQLEVRVGNIGILRGILDIPIEEQTRCLRLLDKRDFDGFRTKLESLGRTDIYETCKRLVNLKGGEEILIEANRLVPSEEVKNEIRYLQFLAQRLRKYGIEDLDLDLSVIRGLDYYTGMVFEIDSPVLGAEKQICGGGSYSFADAIGGGEVFSTGFAIGFDRVLLALERQEIPLPLSTKLDVFVVPIGETMRDNALSVLGELREAGLSSDIDLNERGPSKNLDYTNALGARIAVLVGEDEWSKDSVSVRDMESGNQKEVQLGRLVEEISTLLRD
ncbi:MAG: histidine--tRNA ligase [Thermoplasmata archaeon]